MRKSQQQLIQASNAHDNLQPNGNYNSLIGNGGSAGGNGMTENGNNGSESYSSSSSFTDSYSDSSDLANWEEYVADNGTLFYAEYSLTMRPRPHEKRIEFARNSSLRMGKKNCSMNARKQQHQQQQQHLLKEKQTRNTRHQEKQFEEEFKFSFIRQRNITQQQEQEQEKQLELVITAADRYRFGRRSTAVESILGFRVVPYSDQPECLMVDGFVHDMPAMQQQRHIQMPPIKRGDWFKSLDDIDVRTSNVDELLLQFTEPTKVCLKFQGPAIENDHNISGFGVTTGDGCNGIGGTGAGAGAGAAGSEGSTLNSDLRRIENFPMFAEVFEKLQLRNMEQQNFSLVSPSSLPFSLLILPPECYQNDQHRDLMFVYPELGGNNFLYKSRGSFLTLNAVLGAEMQTKPLSSKLLVDDMQYYVCFRTLNNFLVLFAYAGTYQSLMEANLRSDELINYMRFALPSLTLEHLTRTNESSSSIRMFLHHFCTIQRTRILTKHHYLSKDRQRCLGADAGGGDGVGVGAAVNVGDDCDLLRQCLFEELLMESRSLPLPKEAQLRIFDALSEMEAMDYRNWNDEPLNTHREFFIHGSVLYYDNFLLAAQMPMEMRTRIESFLRCRGIFDFITDQCVKELYVWEEIIPPECECDPEIGRFFLTVCSRSHLILAVILKIFDAPDLAPDAIIPPSLFYIEEIQETLDHLISCGIESLAMFWSISNKRPEALNTMDAITIGDVDVATGNEKESNKLETFIKQKLNNNLSMMGGASSHAQTQSQSQRSISYDEETHLCSSLGGSSIHSLTQSEDDSSRKRLTSSMASSTINNDNGSDSGSDWDNFGEQNPLHYGLGVDGGGGGGELQSQMTESLWKEINNVVPTKISAGWKNAIFHYVYVDSANGTIFCPLKSTKCVSHGGHSQNNNPEAISFLNEIRKACLIIHNVLQNTKNFRRLLAQETIVANAVQTVASNHRFIGLAIKEHGMTIKILNASGKREDNESIFKGNFVVVGRLFHTPTREIYVCHRPDVPQNLVEMAFRLSFFSVG